MRMDGLMLTKNKFTELVIETVRSKKLSYMDAVFHICEENNIEPETVAKYISPAVKSKLEIEAQNLNLIPKGNSVTLE